MEIEIKKVNKKVYWHIFCTKGVKYEIVNSNGGLLGGTWDLESAKKIAKEHIEDYKNDSLNCNMKVWIEELEGDLFYENE